MARAILIVHRRAQAISGLEAWITALDGMLIPSHIAASAPLVGRADGAIAAVFNPGNTSRVRGASIRLGVVFDDDDRWSLPGASAPDGTYALFRTDADCVELVADAAASRTVWYTRTPDLFVASTSQRAIVAVLGSFRPNPEVTPWMLSSGTLGPRGGWDVRLERVRAGGRVTLDRRRWRLRAHRPHIEFSRDTESSRDDAERRLEALLGDVCARLPVDFRHWILPLSGGVDSRGLLLWLRDRPGLRTVTWGTQRALDETGNDAGIARALAEKLGVEHRFVPIELSPEPRERLIDRFLELGEGRVATLSGYVDGFSGWKSFYESGVQGIIRGDEAFGLGYVNSDFELRRYAQLNVLADFFNRRAIERFELPPQRWPSELERRRSESVQTWRDRLYQQSRLSTWCAALTDLKTAYVEVVNPLLSRNVLEFVRSLPDSMRVEKTLWRRVVAARSDGLPFATRPAVLPMQDFVNETRVLEMMLAELSGADDGRMLSPALRHWMCKNVARTLATDASQRDRLDTRRRLPRIRGRLRAIARRLDGSNPAPHPMVFAFRAYLVSRMTGLLEKDASALASIALERDRLAQ